MAGFKSRNRRLGVLEGARLILDRATHSRHNEILAACLYVKRGLVSSCDARKPRMPSNSEFETICSYLIVSARIRRRGAESNQRTSLFPILTNEIFVRQETACKSNDKSAVALNSKFMGWILVGDWLLMQRRLCFDIRIEK
jgi:hypothetical protein